MKILKEEITKKVSYIKIDNLGDRYVPLYPLYLGNSNWEFWIPTENGLRSLKTVGVSEGCYFSQERAQSTDVYIGFINFIMKRAYFKDLAHFGNGILEDINNLSASVVKINLFHEIWQKDKSKISRRFVTTEMEYIFKVCRSLFDLLQEVIMRIWSRFQYNNTSLKTKKLRSSFSEMILYDKQLSTPKKIAERYAIPLKLAEFYECNGKFFIWLKSYRDKVVHSGNSIESLFITDDGFAISTKNEPFKDLDIWEISELKPNGLGSVRSVVSYSILNTLKALEDFSSVIQSIIQFPPDIAPDHNIYIRGENLDILFDLHTYVEDGTWIKKE